jgi:hypothetical protein
VNDRPTILPKNVLTEVREDVPVGTIVANFSISDPDDGNFGDLQVGIETREGSLTFFVFIKILFKEVFLL